MRCLVCHQFIVINRFQELLAFEAPCICATCQQYLIKKKGPCLFEQNDWIDKVIERLEKGDLILVQLFISAYWKEIKKQLKLKSQVMILNYVSAAPYPWIDILLEEVEKRLSKQEREKLQLIFVSVDNISDQTIRIY